MTHENTGVGFHVIRMDEKEKTHIEKLISEGLPNAIIIQRLGRSWHTIQKIRKEMGNDRSKQ